MNTFEKVGFAVASPDHSCFHVVWNAAKSLLDVIGSVDPPPVEKLPVFIALSSKKKNQNSKPTAKILNLHCKCKGTVKLGCNEFFETTRLTS